MASHISSTARLVYAINKIFWSVCCHRYFTTYLRHHTRFTRTWWAPKQKVIFGINYSFINFLLPLALILLVLPILSFRAFEADSVPTIKPVFERILLQKQIALDTNLCIRYPLNHVPNSKKYLLQKGLD